MNKYILECCVDSVESAVYAEKGGANRIELCSNLIIGGTTPGINLFTAVKEKAALKIHVLIRPRFGDFCYTDEEFMIMKNDIEMFRKLGADGVVFGVLEENGKLNKKRMKELIQAAGNMSKTLHRAFDVSMDAFETLKDAQELGIETILTSGQKSNCFEGKYLIKELVKKAGDKIDILVGGGINDTIVEEMIKITGATSYHMSGKVETQSPMTFRKNGINMGLPFLSEYIIYRTDSKEIQKVSDILKNYKYE